MSKSRRILIDQVEALSGDKDEIENIAAYFRELANTMDVSFTVCSCCNKARFNNYPEKLLKDRLEGIATQVDRLILPVTNVAGGS
jgi:hypothetical protein